MKSIGSEDRQGRQKNSQSQSRHLVQRSNLEAANFLASYRFGRPVPEKGVERRRLGSARHTRKRVGTPVRLDPRRVRRLLGVDQAQGIREGR